MNSQSATNLAGVDVTAGKFFDGISDTLLQNKVNRVDNS